MNTEMTEDQELETRIFILQLRRLTCEQLKEIVECFCAYCGADDRYCKRQQ